MGKIKLFFEFLLVIIFGALIYFYENIIHIVGDVFYIGMLLVLVLVILLFRAKIFKK